MTTPSPHALIHEYAELVQTAADLAASIIDRAMARKRGAVWSKEFARVVADYGELVAELRRQENGIPTLLSFLPGWKKRLAKWRRHMEGIAKDAEDKDTRADLLRAVGLGLGTPYSISALEDLLEELAPRVSAYSKQLLELDADEDDLKRPSQLAAEVGETKDEIEERRERLAELRTRAAGERLDVMRWVRDVWQCAKKAHHRASERGDQTAKDAAERLLVELEIAKKHVFGEGGT